MADAAFIAGTGVFFAVCVFYVRAADRMIENARSGNEKRDQERAR